MICNIKKERSVETTNNSTTSSGTNHEKIEKITKAFCYFLTSWGMLSILNYQFSDSCQKTTQSYGTCDTLFSDILCPMDFIMMKFYCPISSTIEKVGGPFLTTLGLFLITNSNSISRFVIEYIQTPKKEKKNN